MLSVCHYFIENTVSTKDAFDRWARQDITIPRIKNFLKRHKGKIGAASGVVLGRAFTKSREDTPEQKEKTKLWKSIKKARSDQKDIEMDTKYLGKEIRHLQKQRDIDDVVSFLGRQARRARSYYD